MVRDQGQVVVGVHDSLTGLRALREAVSAARSRGLELTAVRAYTPGRFADVKPVAVPGVPGCQYGGVPRRAERREQAAAGLVDRAFCEAMGGIPGDLRVRTDTVAGPAREVLVEYVTREHDLLVVGTSRRRWWWPFRPAIGRYCARHAGCPVLVVPPHPAARALGGPRLRWRLRARRELSSLVTR